MATSGDLEYAGFWQRFFAMIPDAFIAAGLSYALAGPLVRAGFDPMGLVVNGASFAVFVAYYTGMQASGMQATVGKLLLGLKVTDAQGGRASAGRVLLRELGKIASAIPLFIGYLLAAFTGRKQALHDMIASTVVVKVAPAKVMLGAIAVVVSAAGAGWLFQTFLAGPMEKAMQQAKAELTGEPLPGAKAAPIAPKVTTAAVAKPTPPTAPQPATAEAPKAPAPAPEAPKAAPAPEPKVATASKPSAAPRAEAKIASLPPMQARAIEAPVAMAPEAPMRAAPRYNDLMSAVLAGDSEGVRELLSLGKWPDKPDSSGTTPLVAAVMRGDRANAELLLKAGANASPALSMPRARNDPAMKDLLEGYRR
jgi:uncharacterized RDD family membrane protein YckC